jgi:hypothetical protein
MDTNIEIQKIATALNQDIQELQRQFDGKKVLLDALGNVCDHPTVETYRDRQIGTCEFCLRKFMTRGNVDQIFSE